MNADYIIHQRAASASIAYHSSQDGSGSGAEEAIAETRLHDVQMELERRVLDPSASTLLTFDLGEIYQIFHQNKDAVRVLEAALARDPDGAGAEDAWFHLAIAHAFLDHPADERRVYARYLKYLSDPLSRATALLNLAEAELRTFAIGEAIIHYEAAIEVSESLAPTSSNTKTVALARYGLAIARDRNGDPRGSRVEMTTAVSSDPRLTLLLSDKSVFFVPEHERFWYLGLALATMAESAQSREDRLLFLRGGSDAFHRWLASAPEDDRFRALASAHEHTLRTELQRLELAPPPVVRAGVKK